MHTIVIGLHKMTQEGIKKMHIKWECIEVAHSTYIVYKRDCGRNFMQIGNARFTKVPLKALSHHVCVMFNLIVFSLQKWLAHFLPIRNDGETIRNEHFSSQQNDIILHIFDQTKISNIPSEIELCHL